MDVGLVGGTGKEGRGLAVRWARAGHRVRLGSRDPAKAAEKSAELAERWGVVLEPGDNAFAAGAEVVVLAVPYAAHATTLRELDLTGKILVDITVPLVPPRVRRVHLPPGGAAALEAQALLGPGVRVVATLHHVSSVVLGDPDAPGDCDVLLCGDDAGARDTVAGLVADLGLRALDAGPLANAVALEALTPVLLHLNHRYGGHAGIRITGLLG